MIWNIAIPLLALAPAAIGIYYGWTYGASLTLRHLIVHLFSLLAAIWLWHWMVSALQPAIKTDSRLLTIGAFLCLYAGGFALSSSAVKLRGPVFRSVRANPVDQFLGVAAGLLAGSIAGGALAMLAVLLVPPNTTLGEGTLIAREWPEKLFRTVEFQVAGIPAGSPEAAVLPAVEFRQQPVDPDLPPDENGMVPVRILPEVTWNLR